MGGAWSESLWCVCTGVGYSLAFWSSHCFIKNSSLPAVSFLHRLTASSNLVIIKATQKHSVGKHGQQVSKSCLVEDMWDGAVTAWLQNSTAESSQSWPSSHSQQKSSLLYHGIHNTCELASFPAHTHHCFYIRPNGLDCGFGNCQVFLRVFLHQSQCTGQHYSRGLIVQRPGRWASQLSITTFGQHMVWKQLGLTWTFTWRAICCH